MKEMKALNGYAMADENATIMSNEVVYSKCSELGMTHDDADLQNIVRLIDAINNGSRIIVDGVYTIKGNASAEVNNDIFLTGTPGESGFIYEGTNSHIFTITKDVTYIDLYGLSFVRSGTTKVMLLWNVSSGENDLNIEKMSVQNCCFENSISLYRQSGDRLYNDSDSFSSVKEFIFSKNHIKNMRTTFCALTDVCFESVEITHNRIENFLYSVFHLGTSNRPANYTEAQDARHAYMVANKKKVLADNNYVFCDDDCILTQDPSYYCFLLAECQSVVYTNNHIEGLKASCNCEIYDAYFGADSVLVENNEWKNIMCFASGKQNNAMMKAKGGGGVKTYRNNRYTITQEFLDMLVEKYDADPANFWVEMQSITDDARWEVIRNVIEIASTLKFFQSNEPAKVFNFIRNDITVSKISGAITTCAANGFALFDGNIIRADNYTGTIYLHPDKRENQNRRITNNTIIAPCATFASPYPGPNDIVSGNRIIAQKVTNLKDASSLDDEFVANEAENVETEVNYNVHHRRKVDIKTNDNCSPIMIKLATSPDSFTRLSVRKVTASGCASTEIAIKVYTDGDVKKVMIANLADGSVFYDGAIILEASQTTNIPGGLLKLRIGGENAQVYSVNAEPCTLYIERETVVA